jgi:hypothetical protein
MKRFLLLSSTLIALGANAAAHAGGITPPIGNYTGVREQDRVIYPHPADLAAPSSEDRRLYDHPAVVIAKRVKQPATLTAAPTLHPALWR